MCVIVEVIYLLTQGDDWFYFKLPILIFWLQQYASIIFRLKLIMQEKYNDYTQWQRNTTGTF